MSGRGFTLVELIATVTVAAVLLSFALPSFLALLAGGRGTAAVNQMIGAVNLARSQAIVHQHLMTLCPGANGGCLGRDAWHRGALLFVDHNGNGSLDGAERVETAFPSLRPGERIYWRSFRNRSYLQFHPRGYTQWQNGSFLYCPPDGDPRQARMVVLNTAGRVRLARDSNGDGIVEDARGSNLECPAAG